MSQVTWRAPDDLIERVRDVATTLGLSVNEYLTRLARAATDPELAGDDAARTRERLARAGLLVSPGPTRRRPEGEAVAAARAEAGRGTPLSGLVISDRS